MAKKYTSFDEYIDKQPEQKRALLIELSNCILTAVPEASKTLNYGVAAFALVKDGKRDQQVMIAAFKNHIGFYPQPVTIKHFANELKSFKTSEGTVQFPLDQPLPKDLIIRMVKYRRSLID